MLSSALNFLSDKRKRFHRSDTMPAFTHDTSLFKLNTDPEQCQDQTPFNAYHSPDSTVREDLTGLSMTTGSNGELSDRSQVFSLDNPELHTRKYPTKFSGSDKNLTTAGFDSEHNPDNANSKNNDNNVGDDNKDDDDDDRDGEDNDDQDDSTSPNSMNRNLSNRIQEAKLRFLNLPATALSPSFTNISRSATNGSPTSSTNSWNSKKSNRDDSFNVESDRDLFKQSTLKVEHMETVVISSSSSYKENVSNELPNEDLPTILTKSNPTGSYSRIARKQTKSSAASRTAKNKVKRSKSTVHMSRHMRDSSQEQTTRERACSAQRKPPDQASDFRAPDLIQGSQVQISKHLADKPFVSSHSRTRSIMPNYLEQENTTVPDLERNYDLLISLAKRGSKSCYYRIDAPEFMESENLKISDQGSFSIDSGAVTADNVHFSIGGSSGLGSSNVTTNATTVTTSAGAGPNISTSNVQFFSPDKIKSMPVDNLSPIINQSQPTTSSKLNKYAVVRRLRRNNSSVTCTTEKPFRSFDESTASSTAYSVAGDLLLPSKHIHVSSFSNKSITGLTQDKWIVDLFNLVDKNDLEQFLRQFEQFHLLARSLSPESERLQNQYELNPLDYALLNGYIPFAIYMILCGFGPGPILQYSLKCGPSSAKESASQTDSGTMRSHLRHLLNESDAHLAYAQAETNRTVEQANSFVQSMKSSKDVVNSHTVAMNQIYGQVGLKEQALTESMNKQDQLLKFNKMLDRFPAKTKPPQRVRLLLEDSHSLLIRITPSGSKAQRFGLFQQSEIVYDERSSCSSSDDLGNFDCLNEGRKVGVTAPSELAPMMVLKYRIEWSNCPKFLNSPVYSCTVEPVFHLYGIQQQGDLVQVRNLNHLRLRTGFYVISNLPVGKMIFTRVYAFSVHGWSEPCYSQPPGITLSNWYECKSIINNNGGPPQQRFVGDSLVSEIEMQKQILIEKVVSWISGGSSGSHASLASIGTGSTGVTTSNTISNLSSIGSGGSMNIPTSNQLNTTLQSVQTANGSQPSNPSFDDTSKRTRSPMLQRKRSFRFLFSNKGFRFVKQVKSGLYLAILCHTPNQNPARLGSTSNDLFKQKYQLVLADDSIPMINVTREDVFNGVTNNLNSDFNWFSKLVSDSTGDMDVQLLCEDLLRSNLPTNLQLRIRLFGALQRLRFLLGTANMGTVYPEIIRSKLVEPNLIFQKLDNLDLGRLKQSNDPPNDTILNDSTKKICCSSIIVLLRQVQNQNDVCLTGNLRWCNLEKFLRQNKIKRMDCLFNFDQSPYALIPSTERMISQLINHHSYLISTRGDQLLLTPEAQIISNLDTFIYYSENRNHQLEPGLYLALIQMQANLDQQATILVSNTSQTMQMFPCQRIRQRCHVSREEWDLFFYILNNPNYMNEPNEQYYEMRDTERRFVIQIFRAWVKLANKLGFPNHVAFQYRIYLNEIIKLSPQHAIIPCFPPVDQVCLRPGLITVTPVSCYWISMAHFERNLGLVYDSSFNPQLFHLISLLELLIPISQFIQRQCFTDQELSYSTERTQSLQLIQSNLETIMQGKRWLTEILAAGRDRKRMNLITIEFEKLFQSFCSWLPGSILDYFSKPESINSSPTILNRHNQIQTDKNSNSDNSIKQYENLKSSMTQGLPYCPTKDVSPDKLTSSIIQVYADYPSGLASGTYVRLLVYSKTTAREIIRIVIRQIKETAYKYMKYGANSDLSDFTSLMDSENEEHSYCLTVSLGHIERQLPHTIRPLLLRHPWRSGKFAVRLISELNQSTNPNGLTPFTNEIHPYRISQKRAFKLTIVENPFVYAHINPPPNILP